VSKANKGHELALTSIKISSLLGEHAHFTGNLSFAGAVRIDGCFEGDIQSEQGTLLLSKTAKLKGNVEVAKLLLHGQLIGNAHIKEYLQMGEDAVLQGDLHYQAMSLEEGSVINGQCFQINSEADEPDKTEAADKQASTELANSQ